MFVGNKMNFTTADDKCTLDGFCKGRTIDCANNNASLCVSAMNDCSEPRCDAQNKCAYALAAAGKQVCEVNVCMCVMCDDLGNVRVIFLDAKSSKSNSI